MSDSAPTPTLNPRPTRLLCPWDSVGKNTGVGCHVLLQEIFPTKGLNPCLSLLLHGQGGSLPLAPPEKAHPEADGTSVLQISPISALDWL